MHKKMEKYFKRKTYSNGQINYGEKKEVKEPKNLK